MKKVTFAALSLIGLGIIIGVMVTMNFNPNTMSSLFAGQQIGAAKPPVAINPQAKAFNDQFVAVSQAVIPTVVSISVTMKSRTQTNPFGEEFREFFRFFGEPNVPSEGSGSGVIVSSNGYIVTNNHVIDRAEEIRVTTNDRRVYKAELVGTDPLTDLAVIKIDAKDLPVAFFANIDSLRIGEWVLAVGNPLGLNSTVTSGIISAINRGGLALVRDREGYSVENFIQTDAPINPGNSGGGLYDLHGGLVGINTAIATRTGTYIGYGFAIPVDLVKAVVEDLIEDGRITRGYIGVRIETINEVMAKAVGLEKIAGALVQGVVENSPAEKAGIEMGDVIIAIDGRELKTSNELQGFIVTKRAGDKVTLTIWRDKKKITKTVKLEPRPDDDSEPAFSTSSEEEVVDAKSTDFSQLGFTIEALTASQRKDFAVDNGVFISKVERGSIAQRRGLVPNGVITMADRRDIKSPSDLKKIIDEKKSGDAILLNVRYKDTSRMVALEIP